jgi:hypothetical protein
MRHEKMSLFIIFILIGSIISTEFANAQVVTSSKDIPSTTTSGNLFTGNRLSSASFVSSKTMVGPDIQTYYRADNRLSTYYPILTEDDAKECKARQDILLMQVPPAGCEPAVVRSDLLAEQNVPVFCKISAIKVNPIIDIKQIKNMRFTGDYPKEVAGVGFHPAKAALNTKDILLGSPLINNVGYVVVVLKKQEKEENLPNVVNLTLTANIEYDAGNAIGIGKSSFLLEQLSDDKWKVEKNRNSFFQGRYFLRVENLDDNHAVVSVYYGDEKIATRDVKKGDKSSEIYIPGFYCQFVLNIFYDGLISANDIARISVDDDEFDVYEGSYFKDNKYRVIDIKSDTIITEEKGAQTTLKGRTGSVEVVCGGTRMTLKLSAKGLLVGDEVKIIKDNDDKIYTIKEIKKEEGTNKNIYTLKLKDDTSKSPYYAEELKPADPNKLYETMYDAETETYFTNAIKEYERVADEYPREKGSSALQENPKIASYGEEALVKAIKLAEEMSKQATEARLINKYIALYPAGQDADRFNQRLNKLYEKDYRLSGQIMELDNKRIVVRLLDIKSPEQNAKAMFSLGSGARFEVELSKTGEVKKVNPDTKTEIKKNVPQEGSLQSLILTQINGVESAKVSLVCYNGQDNSGKEIYTTEDKTLSAGVPVKICSDSQIIKLEYIDAEKFGKIRVEPYNQGTETQTNLSVGVGIEKRAIQLTPEQVYLKLRNLNESIKKWDAISEKLGNLVKTMKAACLATSVVLTVKNFLGGIGGKSQARQEVMRGPGGWTEYCTQNKEQYGGSITKCYNKNAQKINQDVEARANAIEKTNSIVKDAEGGDCSMSTSGFFGGKVVKRDCAAEKMINKIKTDFPEAEISKSLETGDKTNSYINGDVSYTELRDIYASLSMQKAGGMSVRGDGKIKDQISAFGQTIKERKDFNAQSQSITKWLSDNGLGTSYVPSIKTKNAVNSEYNGKEIKAGTTIPGTTEIVSVNTPAQTIEAGGKMYIVLLQKGTQGTYIPLRGTDGDPKIYEIERVSNGKYNSKQVKGIDGVTLGSFTKVDYSDLKNAYKDPEARYFESEPYKGMPAVVPFDLQNGWYAATKQTLPSLGGIKAFEANGRPVSFWICNVGANGKEEFESNGDKDCRQFNLNTGQPLDFFPGQSQEQAEGLVDKAVNALEEAAKQYGMKRISINGESIPVGKPASSVPGTQCQDFMSPGECKLLFNVCDPVVCPSSRCDLGGTNPVANVIQSGIVGSTLLCLPNIKEGIFIPFCVSGIKAGLDGLLSIMKSHYACLMENIKTGKMVGTCDEIYSFYYCELFWRNIGPVANTLLPKLIGVLAGTGGARGGGEYMTTQRAWDNAQQSMKYFTQEYAVNSFQAFNIGSVTEAGTTFCKAFMSSKTPNSLESLIEPDSPAQFHAWFSSIRYTDATVPATSQYKVFYHIFAGNDEGGVGYSVYLKDPPPTSYYQSTPTIQVASGFIAPGEYATETKDFTAPEGYQQLCVNINGRDECGFKQVSTSFAVNSIRDEYVSQELEKKNIVGEKECISGGQSLGSLVQPNLQAGLEETAFPEIYNRGVARICSGDNPGKGTDPSRFVEVGICDSDKIKCWLDKTSVDNAITESNVGAKTEVLNTLEQTQIAKLKEENPDLIFNQKGLDDKMNPLIAQVNGLLYMRGKKESGYSKNIKLVDVESLSLEMENVLTDTFYNKDKAFIILKKGDLWAEAMRAKKGVPVVTAPTTPIAEKKTKEEEKETVNDEVDETEAIKSLKLKVTFFGLGNKFEILNHLGKGTNIYIDPKANKVFFDNSLLGLRKNAELGYLRTNKEGRVIKLKNELDIDEVGVAEENKWILKRLNGAGVDIGKQELNLNYVGGDGSDGEEPSRGKEIAEEVTSTEALSKKEPSGEDGQAKTGLTSEQEKGIINEFYIKEIGKIKSEGINKIRSLKLKESGYSFPEVELLDKITSSIDAKKVYISQKGTMIVEVEDNSYLYYYIFQLGDFPFMRIKFRNNQVVSPLHFYSVIEDSSAPKVVTDLEVIDDILKEYPEYDANAEKIKLQKLDEKWVGIIKESEVITELNPKT